MRLPHNVYKSMLKEKGQPAQNISLFNRVSASPEQKKIDESKLPDKVAKSGSSMTKSELMQKESLEETKTTAGQSEVKVDVKTTSDSSRLKNVSNFSNCSES